MNQCRSCGSYAINLNLHGRDGSKPELCDVCFWRERAQHVPELLEALDLIASFWEDNQDVTVSRVASMFYDARCVARTAIAKAKEKA